MAHVVVDNIETYKVAFKILGLLNEIRETLK